MSEPEKIPEPPTFNPYGIWEVTSGTCPEERLGIFKGYIDEIALALSEFCAPTIIGENVCPLKFTRIEPKSVFLSDIGDDIDPKKHVEIEIEGIPYTLLGLAHSNERLEYLKKVFAGRPVQLSKGRNLDATTMHFSATEIERAKKIFAALDKLTDEELNKLTDEDINRLTKEEN